MTYSQMKTRGSQYNFWGPRRTYLIEATLFIYASLNGPSLVQKMACRLFGAKLLSEKMLTEC